MPPNSSPSWWWPSARWRSRGAAASFTRVHQRQPASGSACPAITVVGALSLVIYIYFLVQLLTNDTLGANGTPGLVAMTVVAVLPFAIYAISYLVNRRRGVDLGIAFRELPPE